MATQQLSDAANSGILDVIIESTACRIFLPNSNALQEEAMPLYINMGLNRRQIEIIASAVPKRDYYYVSGRRTPPVSARAGAACAGICWSY